MPFRIMRIKYAHSLSLKAFSRETAALKFAKFVSLV